MCSIFFLNLDSRLCDGPCKCDVNFGGLVGWHGHNKQQEAKTFAASQIVVYKSMKGWMNQRMDEREDEWMNEWMDE